MKLNTRLVTLFFIGLVFLSQSVLAKSTYLNCLGEMTHGGDNVDIGKGVEVVIHFEDKVSYSIFGEGYDLHVSPTMYVYSGEKDGALNEIFNLDRVTLEVTFMRRVSDSKDLLWLKGDCDIKKDRQPKI